MKQLITIFLIALFTLQAIPVVRLLAAAKNISCATVLDEDNPDESKSKEKKDNKEYLSASLAFLHRDSKPLQYQTSLIHSLPSPFLEAFTPPPNAICLV